MANPTDADLSYYNSQERQPAEVPELPNDPPFQPPKQSSAQDHTEQRTEKIIAEKQAGFRAHRANLQVENPL